MWILGLFLDVEIHIVLLHVEVDRGSWVTVYYWLKTADGCPLAVPGRVWTERQIRALQLGFVFTDTKPKPHGGSLCKEQWSKPTRYGGKGKKKGFIKTLDMQYILGTVYSASSASCSVSLSSNLMSLNQDGSECPSRELTLSLSGDGVSENSVLYRPDRETSSSLHLELSVEAARYVL